MTIKRLLLLTLLALPFCNKSEAAGTFSLGGTLELSVPESSAIRTKAPSADEMHLSNRWVFILNAAGGLQGRRGAETKNNDTHTALSVLPEGAGLSFRPCAKTSAAEEAGFEALLDGSAKLAHWKAVAENCSCAHVDFIVDADKQGVAVKSISINDMWYKGEIKVSGDGVWSNIAADKKGFTANVNPTEISTDTMTPANLTGAGATRKNYFMLFHRI